MHIIILIITWLLLGTGLSSAATYYTDKSGSDANSCATAATAASDRTKAKLTINSGKNCLTTAGDTLIVGNGTYVEGQISMSVSGTQAAPITIKAENKHLAILSSTSSTSCAPNISFSASWLVIDGLKGQIDPSDPSGCSNNSANGAFVRMWGSTTPTVGGSQSTGYVGGTVRNCYVVQSSHRSVGIKSNQDHSLVEGCTVENSLEAFNGVDQVFRNNTILDNDAWGTHFSCKGGARNCQFYNNVIVWASGFQGITLGGNSSCCWYNSTEKYECYNCTAHNNIVRVTAGTSNYTIDVVGCKDCTIYNNVIYGNGKIAMEQGSQSCCLPQQWPNGTQFKNNIVYGAGGTCSNSWGSGVSTTTNYNNFYNCTSAPSQTNAITGDPLFVNAGSGDFGLQAGSPALNAGTNVGLPYNGSAPDVGAHDAIAFGSCAVSNSTPTVINITFENNGAPPLLPASGAVTFTARENTVAKTVSSVSRVGDNQMDVTVSSAFTNGTTIDFSYAVGTVTDSRGIGDSTKATGNQRLNAITNQTCTNNVGGAPSHTFTQARYEYHGLRGTEAAPEIKPDGLASTGAAENVSRMEVMVGGYIRVRFALTCTNANCPATGFYLYYSKNGGAYAVVPDDLGADHVAFCGTSPWLNTPSNGAATTDQLSTSGTFVAGATVMTSNAIPSLTLAQNNKTENEYCVRFGPSAVPGDYYDLRIYQQSGAAIDAYTVTPRITVTGASGGSGF